jgi:large subunit ribosomal protein L6
MSRIGKQLFVIPSGVEVSASGGVVRVKGPKGTLEHRLPSVVQLVVEGSEARVAINDPDNNEQNVLWGTNASIFSNMLEGVTKGFSKQLEINGVGYRAALTGNSLTLNLGFSHPVVFQIPQGITVSVEKNMITVTGIDKQKVGQVAAEIRSLRPPEPYKGKGIKYVDEVIRRKVGKAAAGSE